MQNDEEYGRQLPALLTEEPYEPSAVDIGRAIAVGRQHRRIRYAASGLSALLLAVAIPLAIQSQRPQAPPAAPPFTPANCSIASLPANIHDLVTDPSGRHLAGYVLDRAELSPHPNAYAVPAIWKDNKIQELPVPASWSVTPTAVNRSGAIIGRADEKRGSEHRSFVFANGKFHLLSSPGSSIANAINASGAIVGMVSVSEFVAVPAIWRSFESQWEQLPLPDGAMAGTAEVITDTGVIVGRVIFRPGREVPYRWEPDGTGSALPLADGYGWVVTGGAGDWIYGMGYSTGDGPVTSANFLFNLSTGEFRMFTDVIIVGNASVTSAGWYAGIKRESQRELVFTNGTTTIPLPLTPGQRVFRIKSVSSDGRVITAEQEADYGAQVEPGTEKTSVIWRCD